MTDKELRKLKRGEVLQLLLAQATEIEELQEQKSGLEDQARELEDSLDRLGKKLASKNKQYDKLHRRLDGKDWQIRKLREEIGYHREKHRADVSESANIAEAALRLSHIVDEAREAARQYLYNVSLLYGGEPDEDEMDMAHLDARLAEIDAEDRREAAEPETAESEAAEAETAEATESETSETETAE